jgi:hypothetical protein
MVEWLIRDEDASDMDQHAARSLTIDYQRVLRSDLDTLRGIEDGSTISMPVAAFKPGRRVKDPVAAAQKALAKLTPEQIEKVIASQR